MSGLKEKDVEDTQFLVVVNMLKDFPVLKKRVKKWLDANPRS